MGSTTKRGWKLDEFVAHGGNVKCLALGHKSGRVMVTGGEDKKVNMWAVGKPNCIMSLTGHNSSVESVRFGNPEEMVVAGSMSGAMKIWDLEQAKILRTLTGHKSSIKCLEFHPYGDINMVASGSSDTNVKLWDIRRKGCIFTYKGHSDCINTIRFSPDGRWIASASEDTLVKIWDIVAGKLLTDFSLHTGPVNAVAFHPNEFLMASASSDRTVKFWDLEKFELVSSTGGDSFPIKSICFHPDGLCIYAASQDTLKVYGWEPVCCYDSLSMGWGNVADIAMAHNQLIGAMFSQSNVSTFVADVQRIQPLGGPPHNPIQYPSLQSPVVHVSGRRSFSDHRPPTQSTKQAPVSPKEEPDDQSGSQDDDPAQNSASITDPEDYNKIFHPKKTLAHSPPRDPDPFPAPPDDEPAAAAPPPVKVVTAAPAKIIPPSAFQPPPSEPVVNNNNPTPVEAAKPPIKPTVPKPKQPVVKQPQSNQPAQKQMEIKADDFLPKSANPVSGMHGNAPCNMSESEAVSSIMKGHDSMNAVLNSRGKNLQIVRAMYNGGTMKTAMDSAIGMNDKAIVVDLFNVMVQKPGLWNLDLCTLAVTQIEELLNSKYENYVTSACATLKHIMKTFAPVIKSNLTAPPSIGVDITREERYNKCKKCYQQLMSIKSLLNDKSTVQGKMTNKFRELNLLMNQLD